MVAVDKFNRLTTEEWEKAKKLSGSAIASNCPFIYWDSIINGTEIIFDFEYSSPGKREHDNKEFENKHNPNVRICEETFYLQFKGDGKIPPFLMRVTPDCTKQAPKLQYIEDYKSTTNKSWKYKYDYYKDGLPFGNKMQLSLQKYAIYIHKGHIINKGVINFIEVTDDRTEPTLNEMKVADDLFSFQEIEDFIFTSPAVTEDESTLPAAIKDFKKHSAWLCGWKKREKKDTKKCSECKDLLDKPVKVGGKSKKVTNKPRRTTTPLL